MVISSSPTTSWSTNSLNQVLRTAISPLRASSFCGLRFHRDLLSWWLFACTANVPNVLLAAPCGRALAVASMRDDPRAVG